MKREITASEIHKPYFPGICYKRMILKKKLSSEILASGSTNFECFFLRKQLISQLLLSFQRLDHYQTLNVFSIRDKG